MNNYYVCKGGSIIFGTVDCTVHRQLCNRYNIRQEHAVVSINTDNNHMTQRVEFEVFIWGIF